MKHIFTIVLLFLFFNCSKGQNQNNIWYFGDFAGLNFADDPPVPLNDGIFSHTEGVASICNLNGDLLFFTNGIKVWDANKQVMPNGFGLLGDNSSSQILIVPKPGDCNIFYIFTTPSQSINLPFSYSIVDMSLNGGLGNVTQKNIYLRSAISERICGTLKNNGIDYWIVTQEIGSNAFLSYSLTSTGLNNIPVSSYSGQQNLNSSDVIGCMKISSNGKKIAYASELGHKKCQVFDFDNTTGLISNPIELTDIGAYGVEFSPNSEVLYFSKFNPFKLLQFDLSSNNSTTIQASLVALLNQNSTQEFGGALQLAPNNKIYLCRSDKTFIDVINSPNTIGTNADYNTNSINLNGRKCLTGFPNFISKYSNEPCGKIKVVYQKIGCSDKHKVIATSLFGMPPYTYSLDGNTFQLSNIFTGVSEGVHSLTIKDLNLEEKNINFTIKLDTGLNIKLLSSLNPNCGKNDGEIMVLGKNGKEPYTYSKDGIIFGNDNKFKNLLKGQYSITVKDDNGCISLKSITLEDQAVNSNLFAGNDTLVFFNDSLQLNAYDFNNSQFNKYEWTPNFKLSNSTIKNPVAKIIENIIYFVKAENTITGCKGLGKILINVTKKADIYIAGAFTPNNDGKNDILKAKLFGINKFRYLTVFNRNGQIIFTTSNENKGWNGLVNGNIQDTQAYVWITEGIDYEGNLIKKKGTVILIK